MYRKIAEILGVSEEDITAMPTEILNSMQALFETINVETDSDRKNLYSELDKLWTKGVVFLGLKVQKLLILRCFHWILKLSRNWFLNTWRTAKISHVSMKSSIPTLKFLN